MQKEIKLYDIPRNSKIYCECDDGSTYITFHRLDGAYSYCTTEKGGVTHLGGAQPLLKYKDGYELAPRKKEPYKGCNQMFIWINESISWTKETWAELKKSLRHRKK